MTGCKQRQHRLAYAACAACAAYIHGALFGLEYAQLAQKNGRQICLPPARGYAVWRRILEAVAELTRTKPAEGERVN